MFFFFFSSRRRHTRCGRDWSSDVCSSDLPAGGAGRGVLAAQARWLEEEQPAYLVTALGRPGSPAWRALALEIERYRRASGITSRVSTLGAAPPAQDRKSTRLNS